MRIMCTVVMLTESAAVRRVAVYRRSTYLPSNDCVGQFNYVIETCSKMCMTFEINSVLIDHRRNGLQLIDCRVRNDQNSKLSTTL